MSDEQKKPTQIEDPDFTPLAKICQEYLDALERDEYVSDDLVNYVFERAMECLFGKEVWSWINARL